MNEFTDLQSTQGAACNFFFKLASYDVLAIIQTPGENRRFFFNYETLWPAW